MGRDGIALIVTLWVIVLLSVAALSFSSSIRVDMYGARNFKEDAQAYYIATSVMQEAVAYLMSDPDLEVDYIGSGGQIHTDEDREPPVQERTMDNAQVTLTIEDEESRINLNSATLQMIQKLFELTGAEEELLLKANDIVADWIDPDDLHRLNGAEDEEYEELGYRTKNRLFDLPEEILLLKDIPAELYFGGGDYQKPLKDFITTRGEKINVNTASAEVLEVVGFNEVERDTVIESRESFGGYRPSALRGMFSGNPHVMNMFTTASTNFRITAAVRHDGSPRTLKFTTVIRRDENSTPGKATFKTLFFRESYEDSGA